MLPTRMTTLLGWGGICSLLLFFFSKKPFLVSTVILSLPLIQEGQLSVSIEILVNLLED